MTDSFAERLARALDARDVKPDFLPTQKQKGRETPPYLLQYLEPTTGLEPVTC